MAAPINGENRAPFSRAALRSRKGTSIQSEPAEHEAQDGQLLSLDGKNVGGDELERREHEGEIPFGLDAERGGGERVGLLPDLPGQEDAEDADQDEDERPAQGVLEDKIGEERYLLDRLALRPIGLLMPRIWTRRTWIPMMKKAARGRMATWSQKNRVSVAWETLRAAQDQRLEALPDKGKDPGNIRPDAGGKVRQLIPGQQIAAEAEGQEDNEQEESRDPGQLARPAGRP